MPRAQYFPKVQRLDTSFCMLGWGGATTDAIFTLQPVLHSRNDKGDGDFNWGNYKDANFDEHGRRAPRATPIPSIARRRSTRRSSTSTTTCS